MAIDIFTEAINTLQRINETIDEVAFAPLLENYPAQIDTNIISTTLTQIGPNSLIPLNCPAQPATLNMVTTIYIQAENQGIFPEQLVKAYRVAGNWRKKYFDPRTYLENDATRKELVNTSGLQIYINPTGAETFSGYTISSYPNPEHRFHSIVMTLSLRVQDASC